VKNALNFKLQKTQQAADENPRMSFYDVDVEVY